MIPAVSPNHQESLLSPTLCRFRKENKSLKIINETKGREEEATPAFVSSLLDGLTETMYNNTISISQLKSATDEGMVSELKNYIANMNTSGNMALNITKATAYLKNQRKQFESQLSPEASVNYTSLLSEIRALERELSSPKYENQLQEYSKLRDSVRNELEHQKIEKEDLAEDEEKSLKNDIQDLVNEYNKDIERLMKEKEQELMTI